MNEEIFYKNEKKMIRKTSENGTTIEHEFIEEFIEPEPLSNIEQAILETAVNMDYLVTLNDLTL